MRKIAIFICLFLLGAYNAYTQNFLWGRYQNNGFNNIVAATASDITSNYGDRNATGGTRFHRGVDISPIGAQNVIVAAPLAGTITDIVNPGPTSIRILEILLDAVPDPNNPNQNLPQTRLRFLHIFPNGNLPIVNNGFRLQTVTVNNTSHLVIIDLVNCRAFSVVPGLQVTCNGQPISPNNPAILTVNRFAANWPLVPMGNSGMHLNNQGNLVPYPYHIHVSQLENGSHLHNSFTESINPFHDLRIGGILNNMECRIRKRNMAPVIDINHGNNCEESNTNGIWNSFVPNYNNSTRTIVEAEVYLDGATSVPAPNNPPNPREDRYSNAFMNESLIEIQINKNGTAGFQLIQGKNYESRFQVDPRGNDVIYPDRMRTHYGGTAENESGCNPYSYTSAIGFHPHDYYVTPDFYHRIHYNHTLGTPLALANYPWDARYPDGDYSIRAQVTNIDGVIRTQNPPVVFDIDNFKPFIREVEVKFEQEGADIYSNSWSPDPILSSPSRLQLGPLLEGGVSNVSAPGPLTIYAKASETMQSVSARIPSLTTEDINGVLIDASTNQWKLTFNNITLPLVYGDCHKMLFSGLDLNGNQLLNFDIESSNPNIPTNCNQGITKKFSVPKRTSLNPDAWDDATPTGVDKVHRFRILECGPMHNGASDPDNNTDCELFAQSISTDVYFVNGSQQNGSISLSVSGNQSGLAVTWFDTEHNEIGQGLSLLNVLPDWYCYEAKQECCLASDCVEVGSCALTITPIPHHPSALGVSDGSIVISPDGGNEPLSYIWNTGTTTSTISNLDVGIYTVTVSDSYHCSSVATVELINCPAITVEVNAITFMPSACDATDGFINLNSNNANGGTSPYAFHWEDDNGNIISNGANDLPNLAPGLYCLVAVDANGCTGSRCFDLKPDHYPTLEETILPSCTNQSNGSIFITANSSFPGFYTFTWDDDVEDFGDVYSWRENLSSGTYCVTITSEVNFCSVTKCYDVPSVSPSSPLSETHTTSNPCPGANNGSIHLTINGGVEPYTFDWLDISTGPFDPKDRGGLGAGTYIVIIKDYCGTTLSRVFTLKPIEIYKVGAVSGCAGQGQIDLIIKPETGNLPYSVSWSNGATTEDLNNLPSGTYCVSITDAAGCITSRCLPLANKEYSISVTEPCEAMSDGVITVNISNPNEGVVIVHLNGLQVYINPEAPISFPVNIPSLNGNTSYNIDVTIEDCVYPASAVTLGTHPVEHGFDSYQGGNCVYNDKCNGNIIPGSEVIITPSFDMSNGSGSWLTECKIPVFCPNVTGSVGNMHVNKEWVKAAEYEQILLQAWNYGFSQDILDSRSTYFHFMGLKDCDNVRYCPANLRITTISHTLRPNVEAISLGNDCYALDCNGWLPGNNNFCVDDPGFLPHLFEQYGQSGTILESCNPASINLYQLIVWDEDLKATYPTIYPTSDLYLQYVNYYRNNPVAKCARVIFCQTDFSVLWSDVASVSCDDYSWVDLPGQLTLEDVGVVDCGETYVPGEDCISYACYSPSSTQVLTQFFYDPPNGEEETYSFYGNFERICPEFPGHFFTTPGNDGLIKNSGGCTKGEMINFGKAILDGRSTPKGVTKCGNAYNFMDYSINSRIDALTEIPEAEYLVDDWDSSQIVLVRKVETEKSYSIECHSDIEWSRLLTSNVRLQVSYFEKEGNEYVIGGEFLGNLNFELAQISSQYINSGFVIRVSPQGALLNYNIIQNLDPQKPLVFVRGADGVHIIGRSTNQPLTVDGTVYPTQSGYLTDVRTGGAGGSMSSNLLAFDTSLTIVRSQRSSDNSRITYVLRGSGTVQYDGQQVVGNSSQDLILVTCNNTGNVIWTEKINGQNIAGQDFDIVYGAGNNVLIGLTYNNAISVQGQVSVSNGSSDILLVRFNEVGQVAGMLNYGTTDGENISKMFFADSILYFGGEFEGDTTSRKIGAHTFLTISNTISTPYISFITESSFTQEVGRGALSKERKNVEKAKSNSISVYPNPFTNALTLRVESNKLEQVYIKVFDGIGHLVTEEKQQATLGANEYLILTPQYPNGVYLIQVLTESGTTWSQKIVKN